MRITGILFFIFLFSKMFGQKPFLPGIFIENGASSIHISSDVKPLNPDGTELRFKYGYAFGLGLSGDWHIDSSFSISLSGGVRQRRALFRDYPDDPLPRYEFNYIHLTLGTTGYIGKKRLRKYINGGVAFSMLFSGWRVYDTGADLISDDLNKLDIGVAFELGIEYELKRKDRIILGYQLYGGFTELFRGSIAQNGLFGKNIYSGIRMGYVLGRR